MNYTNTFEEKPERHSQDQAPTYRFKVMVNREFYERGGFATEDEAAWECDKVRMWAKDMGLCGRVVAYNFPDRVAKISSSEYENPHISVSQFLARVHERSPKRNAEVSPSTPSQSPEVTAAQLEALTDLRDWVDKLIANVLAAKFSPIERDAMVKKANALRNEIVEATTRRS